MQEVFNFILSHYKAFLDLIMIIIAIVLFIVRKKPVSVIPALIHNAAIIAVKLVEADSDLSQRSQAKLETAINYVYDILKISFPDIDYKSYRSLIVSTIEDILSTPQKKEVK